MIPSSCALLEWQPKACCYTVGDTKTFSLWMVTKHNDTPWFLFLQSVLLMCINKHSSFLSSTTILFNVLCLWLNTSLVNHCSSNRLVLFLRKTTFPALIWVITLVVRNKTITQNKLTPMSCHSGLVGGQWWYFFLRLLSCLIYMG